MFISGAENVYPAQVEAVISDHPQVREVAVIGIPCSVWGEAGCAFVAAWDGRELDEAELDAYCRAKLASYQCPQRFIVMAELPKNGTGKVDKGQLIYHLQRV